jgi:hypothetical protein
LFVLIRTKPALAVLNPVSQHSLPSEVLQVFGPFQLISAFYLSDQFALSLPSS